MGDIREEVEENKTKGNIVKIICQNCNNRTNHIVAVSIDVDGVEEYDECIDIHWNDHYQIIKCQGCDAISFRHTNWFSENEDGMGNGTTERLYPKRDANSINVKDFFNVPLKIRRIYRESIDAYNVEALTLCAAGLRGIVEGICADQSVDDGPVERIDGNGDVKIDRKGNLEGKIFGLCERGILTKKSALILHEHRYLGNEAVHELTQPSSDELKLAIGMMEHVLEQLYEIPKKALELQKERTKRKRRST